MINEVTSFSTNEFKGHPICDENKKQIIQFQNKYSFLSNFTIHDVVYEGISYSSSETAFQCAKFGDNTYMKKLHSRDLPHEAKRVGRHVVLPKNWESIKDQIMFDIVTNKFSNKFLKISLAATKGYELIEGNLWGDKYWGVDLTTMEGENHLGKILMKVRDEIIRKEYGHYRY